MGKAGAQPCHRHLENRWTGPNSPSCRVGGVQADQGPYYHSLGSEETVSQPSTSRQVFTHPSSW